METKIYTTSATATGGRSGHVTSVNGELDIDVRMPGTPGNHLNPEILFASGYAACFDNAILSIVRQLHLKGVTHATTVEVTLGKNENGGFGFEISIEVVFEGIELSEAEKLVTQAHQVCPYSNATRGNVEVNLQAKVK